MPEPSFCQSCGTQLETRRIEGRQRDYCPSCERPWYRNPKPCAGVLVVEDDAVLLVQRSEPPEVGSWSVPAGYLEVDEPPLAAATRELAEETGVSVTGGDPDLFETQFVEHPDGTYVLVLVYVVPRSTTTGTPRAGDDAQAVRFWTLEELQARPADIETGYASLVRTAITEFGSPIH
jgi:ADP-ribose pyrophosphatase YjhB (NUDIX family)